MKLFKVSSLLISLIIGLLIAGPFGAIAGVGFSLIPKGETGLMADLFPEVWTGEMVKKFRHDDAATFLAKVPSYDQYAMNDVIHLVDVGADPDVLVNNTTYPIDVQNLGDQDIAISLNKFQTKATRVTDDELDAITYDKMASVLERHRAVITETKHDMSIHAFGPASNTAATPVVTTTGGADGSRRMLTRKDLIALKKKFDAQKIPNTGRILVLCNDHVNDLLLFDQNFAEQYYNYTSGKIANMYSFEVHSYPNNPYYDGVLFTKKAFGSVPGDEDFQASVAFYAPRMFKAAGTTKTYMSKAADNPTTQENLMNFRHYFIALPKKAEAYGAIVSTYVDIATLSDNTNIKDKSSGAVVTAIGVETITVVATTTAAGIIAAVEPTDSSVQTYAVTASNGTPKTGATALVTGDKLVVTAENGVQTNTYAITVAAG
jgi:hypothetical protein